MSEASLRNNVMAQRIRNKMGPRVPNIPRRGQTAVMGEINKSIEKMSIGEMGGNGKGMKQSRQPSGPPQTTALMQPNRRDSNWTVSTEGYGSMRSNTSTSRRCSELSQVKLFRLHQPSVVGLLFSSLNPFFPPDVSSVRPAGNAVACLGPDLAWEQQTKQRGRRGEDEPGHEPPLDEAAQEGPRGRHNLQLGSGTAM